MAHRAQDGLGLLLGVWGREPFQPRKENQSVLNGYLGRGIQWVYSGTSGKSLVSL